MLKQETGHRQKKWTILVYANGNNDLEPEIQRSFQTMTQESVAHDVTIVLQVARASTELVQLIRPRVCQRDTSQWDGVRRYKIHHTGVSFLEDLGYLNMADPRTLAQFITWGVTHYPSNHVMVILSGHGAGFVGAMNDLTQPTPCIMSLKGIGKAFEYSHRETRKAIDILVLDACFMNMIGVWHEIALIAGQPVKYLIAPLGGNTPLAGLPWYLLIRFLQNDDTRKQSLPEMIVHTVDRYNQSCQIDSRVLAMKLTEESFNRLKIGVDRFAEFLAASKIDLKQVLAEWYKNRPNYPLISLLDLVERLTSNVPGVHYLSTSILEILEKVILYPSIPELPRNMNQGPSLYLPVTEREYLYFLHVYNQLVFSGENKWVHVIRKETVREELALQDQRTEKQMIPALFPMTATDLLTLILKHNPRMSVEQAVQVMHKLGWGNPYLKRRKENDESQYLLPCQVPSMECYFLQTFLLPLFLQRRRNVVNTSPSPGQLSRIFFNLLDTSATVSNFLKNGTTPVSWDGVFSADFDHEAADQCGKYRDELSVTSNPPVNGIGPGQFLTFDLFGTALTEAAFEVPGTAGFQVAVKFQSIPIGGGQEGSLSICGDFSSTPPPPRGVIL
ncbi:clostripain-related cysteine peptidase [Brevibacillus sp. NPDC003359]|uniref:clostripain-related cysteine peptidase n=1 Tax=unclassified Brevibacillus TaxID=2684853 RepID=UPI0036CBB202